MGTGQDLETLVEVRPGQEVKLPALMDASTVELTGKPDVACRHQIMVPTLGRSLALRATGPVGCCWRTLSSGRREKRQ